MFVSQKVVSLFAVAVTVAPVMAEWGSLNNAYARACSDECTPLRATFTKDDWTTYCQKIIDNGGCDVTGDEGSNDIGFIEFAKSDDVSCAAAIPASAAGCAQWFQEIYSGEGSSSYTTTQNWAAYADVDADDGTFLGTLAITGACDPVTEGSTDCYA